MVRPNHVDRTESVPFLLRIFVAPAHLSGHYDKSVYGATSVPPPSSEVQVYAWRDSTLQEVLLRLMAARGLPASRLPRISIRHVFLDAEDRSGVVQRDIGIVFVRELAKEDLRGPGLRTMQEHKVQPGDMLELAFLPDNRVNGGDERGISIRGRGGMAASASTRAERLGMPGGSAFGATRAPTSGLVGTFLAAQL
jgi:hypothetical protein